MNSKNEGSKGTRVWTLLDRDGLPYSSPTPGSFGGHRKTRVYGRLDCRVALSALARGGYRPRRVFFLDAETARAAGFRPCAVCLPLEYSDYKSRLKRARRPRAGSPGLKTAG